MLRLFPCCFHFYAPCWSQQTRPPRHPEKGPAPAGSFMSTAAMTAMTSLPAASSPTAPWLRPSSASMATVMPSSSSSLCPVSRESHGLPAAPAWEQVGAGAFVPPMLRPPGSGVKDQAPTTVNVILRPRLLDISHVFRHSASRFLVSPQVGENHSTES